MKEKPEDTNLYSAVHSSGEEAASGDCEGSDATLVSQQRLSTDHVVHAPHLGTHRRCEPSKRHGALAQPRAPGGMGDAKCHRV